MALDKNRHFEHLVEKLNPIGKVIAINKSIIRVKGLQPININALIMFENGEKGLVREIRNGYCLVMYLGVKDVEIGMRVVLQHHTLVSKVGKAFRGRVVNVFGEPLDGKGPIATESTWEVFRDAPKLFERSALSDSLISGVTVIDSIVPIVKGQRLAIIGDSKSGKSMLATQIALNQQNNDILVIYVLIAKRRSEVSAIISKFNEGKALDNAIIIVSTIYDSLSASYLAPYVGCAMAEYFWQTQNQDVLIVYDDLTTHAMVYREVSLLNNTSPGRDSYPGDIFYIHSSLLERAGRLKQNSKTLTVLPIVLASGGDITAYLPTNIMSITDGQWILDMQIFKDIMRPALNIGLSVTRVGGVGFNKLQKELNLKINKLIAGYRQALEFSHFGSELALESQTMLIKGKVLYKILNQSPSSHFSLWSQILMLDMITDMNNGQTLDADELKRKASEMAKNITDESHYQKVKKELMDSMKVELKK